MTPEFLRANAPTMSPEASRFVLELQVQRGVEMPADIVAVLIRNARVDRPDYKVPTRAELFERRNGGIFATPEKAVEASVENAPLAPTPAELVKEEIVDVEDRDD